MSDTEVALLDAALLAILMADSLELAHELAHAALHREKYPVREQDDSA